MEHITVLLNEGVEALNIKKNGIYVDATLGGGGHSSLILKKLDHTGHLYCFDQDDYAFTRATEKMSEYKNYTFIKSNFVDLKNKLEENGVSKIDGIIYDLGVSSFQFDIPERGFSYKYNAPLDMRMDQNAKLTAKEVVNTYPMAKLWAIFEKYGEEKFARNIAGSIVKYREKKEIETTFELVDIIKSSMPQKALNSKGHPAKKVFQALRIEVNHELRVFEDSLNDAVKMLNPGGRCVVISFHSLEDRICKHIFKELTTDKNPSKLPIISTDSQEFTLISKHPILPNEEEIQENNRCHSAKMRVIEKN